MIALKSVLPYIIMTIGSFLYVFETVILKHFKHVPLVHQLFSICFSATTPSIFVVMYYKYLNFKNKIPASKYDFNFSSIFTNKNRLLVEILMVIFFITAYNGYKTLPASFSVPIFMLAPLMLLFLSRFINKTKINIGQIISAFVSLFGVVLVSYSKTSVDKKTLKIGIITMVIGLLCYATAYTLQKYSPKRVFLKGAIKKEHEVDNKKPMIEKLHINLLNIFALPFLVFGVLSVVILYLPKSFMNKLPIPYQGNTFHPKDMLKMVFAFFIFNYGHNLAFFFAYNNLPLSIYGALENNNVLASLIIGYFVLKEKMTLQKLIGCAIIVIGILSGVHFEKDNKLKRF